jgi:hypothetical protein
MASAATSASASVPRVRWDDPEARHYLQLGQPVVLVEGCPLVRRLVERWSFAHLASAFDGREQLQVHYAPQQANAPSDTTFARVYGNGLGAGGVQKMSFREFAKAAASESPLCRHYLAAPLVRHRNTRFDDDDDDVLGPPRESVECCCSGEIEAELTDDIDWAWLATAQADCGPDSFPFDMAQLWAGRGSGLTPLHFDALSNFFCKVRGQKQFLLYPPSQSFLLYPFPVGHPQDNFAMVDGWKLNTERFPASARATGLEATLGPGDVLYVPRYHWHTVRQTSPGIETISLNFWFGRKGTGTFKTEMRLAIRQPAEKETILAAAKQASDVEGMCSDAKMRVAQEDDACIGTDEAISVRCLLAGRHVEGCTKELLGDDAGDFLNSLARGEDVGWSTDSTIARHAASTRGELISLLEGVDRANALLRAMTWHGRLHPGLAPPVKGEIVNSERGELSSVADYEAAKAAASPSIPSSS